MGAWLRGWRPLLRLAWRDVRRARARSALVLALVALPVLAVTTALVLTATADVTGDEAPERRLGAADARIRVEGLARVGQTADPDRGSAFGEGLRDDLTLAGVGDVLGREVRGIEWESTELSVLVDGRGVRAAGEWIDLRDPLTTGLATLDEGRLPEAPGEVMVNRALADRGPGVGETLTLVDGSTLEVVGVGEDAESRAFPHLWSPQRPDGVPEAQGTTWLVEAGPVTWDEVRALNDRGAFVLSRAVLADPPSAAELHPEVSDGEADDALVAAVVLIVVMVLIEVVLLAGPAFAVTARRQARTLALMAAVGATPAQARRAVLAVAVVLGGLAAVGGVVLGIGLAAALLPFLARWSGSYPGPFDVPWALVLGVACCGLLAALLAAAAPAWLASRADVVAVLAGRRGDAAPSRRSPVLGLLLFAAGVALAVAGTRQDSYGENWVALAAVVCVLGMVLLVPVVLGLLARLGARLPLPLRYAVRDAVRHRTRTVPAVAAVAATVCGVVALGISTSSDAAQSRETYTPQLRHGEAVLVASEATPEQWERAEEVLRAELPEADVSVVTGVPAPTGEGDVHVAYRPPATSEDTWLLGGVGSTLGTTDVVAERIPAALRGLDAAGRARGDAALAQGRVVVFTDEPVEADRVVVTATSYDGRSGEEEVLADEVTLPAAYVVVAEDGGTPFAVLPPASAEELGLPVATTSLHVAGAELDRDRERAVSEAVAATLPWSHLYVERGYFADDFDELVAWVLGALGAVLMVGGTLTVTLLALSDARPDLATLSAVGASPRTRRAVAASYALVVGGTGAVLGALVGFVPGVAAAVTLTRDSYAGPQQVVGPFVEVPWLMIAVVVLLLPLLTAGVVALATRSQLPLVARVD
ncbi:FtsX-like permease family protein [Nocardioides solisilvae]|uniref:FtsX-like permease family protein n=1 Tax=Nocardioides solisilvae TaxID=1542435 RepID=UPI000D7461D5|nr:FtsX-like permease family protein [Nocardioides solisilvae]